MENPEPTALLTAAAERTLARQIEAGVIARQLLRTGERPVPASEEELAMVAAAGLRAWQDFLLANLRLVWKLAGREAARTGLAADELFQEGFLALAGALQRFDPDRGRFSTFATVRIRQQLAEVAAGRLGSLPVPPSRALRLRRARGLEVALAQERGHAIATGELAAELGRPVEWTRRLLSHRPTLALEASELVSIPELEPADPDQTIYAQQLRRVVGRLDPDQARVLALRYGLGSGLPLETTEVAMRLEVSESTVRRLERRGLAALRELGDLIDPFRDGPLAG